ncbi:putative transporter MCH4 [Hypsizygus marmoreus]|uniref:Transporter MCH4 n=1 Tax=Hypsizygus marmoreus TaxID=39966 RepID=A0A369KEA3_HYPMA|nr:putative transporter MCH4 [Hypsizygus marmoreus]
MGDLVPPGTRCAWSATSHPLWFFPSSLLSSSLAKSEEVVYDKEVVNVEVAQVPLDEVPDGGTRAWLVLLGSAGLAMSTFGYAVSWGSFQAYYELTLLKGSSSSAIAWIGSLQFSFMFLPGFAAGRLVDLGYFRLALLTAMAALTAANFLIAECTKYWHFLLCQGVVLGLSAGCIYIPTLTVISHWFKVRRPLAFSLITIGSSIGGIIYPIIFRNLLPSVGFRWTVRVIAFINLATFIVAGLTMHSRVTSSKALPPLFDLRPLLSPAFCVYILSTFFSFLGLYTPLTFLSLSATYIGIDPSFTLYLTAISNGSSTVGRVLSGFLAVRYGPLNVMIVSTTLAAAFTYAWPFVEKKAAFIVITCLYGFFSGAFIGLFPVPVSQPIFGEIHDLGRRTGMLMSVLALGALAGPPISGAILQKHHNFHAVGVYAGTTVVASVAAMIVVRYMVLGKVTGSKF